MNQGADTARSLYLELRASRLDVWVVVDPRRTGSVLDYGIVVEGLHRLSVAEASDVIRRILDNENDLVRLLANERDPDLRAIRREGNCG
jgi:hypothetical protein